MHQEVLSPPQMKVKIMAHLKWDEQTTMECIQESQHTQDTSILLYYIEEGAHVGISAPLGTSLDPWN